MPGQCHAHRRKQPPNKGLKKRKKEGRTEIERESEKNRKEEMENECRDKNKISSPLRAIL